MGRGRAKAKQAKVARQLKYSGAATDLEALRKELASGSPSSPSSSDAVELDELDDDEEYDDSEDDEDTDDFGHSYGVTGR